MKKTLVLVFCVALALLMAVPVFAAPKKITIAFMPGVADPFQDHAYRSAFADYMWQAYRAGLGLAAPSLSPAPGTFEGAVDVMVRFRHVVGRLTAGSRPTAGQR